MLSNRDATWWGFHEVRILRMLLSSLQAGRRLSVATWRVVMSWLKSPDVLNSLPISFSCNNIHVDALDLSSGVPSRTKNLWTNRRRRRRRMISPSNAIGGKIVPVFHTCQRRSQETNTVRARIRHSVCICESVCPRANVAGSPDFSFMFNLLIVYFGHVLVNHNGCHVSCRMLTWYVIVANQKRHFVYRPTLQTSNQCPNNETFVQKMRAINA